MRRLLVAVMLVGVLPLAASAEVCVTGGVVFSGPTPTLTDVVAPTPSPVKVAAVGQFLWVEIDGGETLSVDIPDEASGFSVCQSGDVTFTFPEVEPEPSPVVNTPSQTVNVVELWRPWFVGSAL